jgi:hypothetical protein
LFEKGVAFGKIEVVDNVDQQSAASALCGKLPFESLTDLLASF